MHVLYRAFSFFYVFTCLATLSPVTNVQACKIRWVPGNHARDVFRWNAGCNISIYSSVPASSALLLCSSSLHHYESEMSHYHYHTLTKMYYAHSLGYDVVFYVHPSDLPRGVSGYMVKAIALNISIVDLNYTHVFFTDWDSWISPLSSIKFETLFFSWPNASIILQAETGICTGVMLFRKSLYTQHILNKWWYMTLGGCCFNHPADQVAFTHVLLSELAPLVGNASAYNKSVEVDLLNTGKYPRIVYPHGHGFLDFLIHSSFHLFNTTSPIGFAGYPSNPFLMLKGVELHSSLGFWPGTASTCLVYHHGNRLRDREPVKFPFIMKQIRYHLSIWRSIAAGHE